MTIVGAPGGGNWNSGGTWVGGVIPTAADDVQLTATSGNVTMAANSVCRSLDCTGYLGLLTHNSGVTLSIGDGTAGASNVAIKLVATMTYTYGSATSSVISLVSTSATQQTLNFANLNMPTVAFSTAGSWKFLDGLTAGGNYSQTAGTVDTNSTAITVSRFQSNSSTVRTLTMGSSIITAGIGATAFDFGTTTNLTVTANTATFNMPGGGATFSGGNKNYNGATLNMTGSGAATIQGGNTFGNLTRTGTAVKGDSLVLTSGFQGVTGVLTLNGNSAINRLFVQSSIIGTQRGFTNTGTTVAQNVGFMDIGLTNATDLSAITGGSGDAGGNTGITFTPSVTQTWSGTSGGNWSTNAWTTRVPLPQDDVIIASAFIAGQTITADMPRLGRSINFTGTTGTPSFTNTLAQSVYGSLILAADMTLSGTNALTLGGRSNYTLGSAGQVFPQQVILNAPNGTYTQQDNFSNSRTLTGAVTVTSGTWADGGFNFTLTGAISTFVMTGGGLLNSGIWTLNGTAAGSIWAVSGSTTVVHTGSIVIAAASTNARTFAGNSKTYGTLTYTVAGSTGALTISGSNAFDVINFSDVTNARTITFTASTTTNIKSAFNVNGTSGKLMTINSTTAGVSANLTFTGTGTISCAYLSLKDSTPLQAATWFAGHNSTFVSNTGNWIAGVIMSTGFTSSLGTTSTEVKQATIHLTSGMTMGGGLAYIPVKKFVAALGFVGGFGKRLPAAFTAVLGMTSTIQKSIRAPLTATIGFVGTVQKAQSRAFFATMGFIGSLPKPTPVKRFLSVLGFSKQAGTSESDSIGDFVIGDDTFGQGNSNAGADIGHLSIDLIKSKGLSFITEFTATKGPKIIHFLSTLSFAKTPRITSDAGIGGFGFGDEDFGQGTGVDGSDVGVLDVKIKKSKGLFMTGVLTVSLRKGIKPRPAVVGYNKDSAPKINVER